MLCIHGICKGNKKWHTVDYKMHKSIEKETLHRSGNSFLPTNKSGNNLIVHLISTIMMSTSIVIGYKHG